MPPCEASRVGTISLNLQMKETEAQEDEVIALRPPVSHCGGWERERTEF